MKIKRSDVIKSYWPVKVEINKTVLKLANLDQHLSTEELPSNFH